MRDVGETLTLIEKERVEGGENFSPSTPRSNKRDLSVEPGKEVPNRKGLLHTVGSGRMACYSRKNKQ